MRPPVRTPRAPRAARRWVLPFASTPRRGTQGKHAQGQVLVLFAMLMVVLLGSAAIVVDLGLLRTDRARLQNALDAGALAASQALPVSSATGSSNYATVRATAVSYTQANMPGVAAPTVTYKCLVGIDTATGLPRVADMPSVCNVTQAAASAAWRCTEKVCWAPCDPGVTTTDVCNTVQVSGSATRQYGFGPVVGVNNGSTGAVTSAACRGACGSAPTMPVDVVVIIDRTSSMSGDETNLRNAAYAVLQAYDPAIQHVALGMLGPSGTSTSCSGTPSGVHGLALDLGGASAVSTGNGSTWVQSTGNATGGASTLVLTKPTGTAQGDLLVAGITVDGGSAISVTSPAGWTLLRRTDASTNLSLLSYWKLAGASEASSYTFTVTSTRATGGIVRFSGVDQSNPVEASSGSSSVTASTSATAPAITVTAGSAQVGFFAADGRTGFTVASGMTERFDQQQGTAANPGPTLEGATATTASAGSFAAKTATIAASNRWAAQMISVKAAAVDAYGTNTTTDINEWIPVGMTGTGTGVDINEAYVDAAGALNTNSQIVKAIACFDLSSTGTNLATPLEMARAFLATHGRAGVKQGIIFETDGQPNYNGSSGDASNYTCAAATTAASAAKTAGIEVFTIGFGVGSATCPDGGTSVVSQLASMSTQPSLGTTTCTAAENTDGDHFFCQPAGSDLAAVFRAAAVQLSGGSRLIQLYPRPAVTSISPTSGSKAGGVTVTVNGSGFTDAYQVTFAGTQASTFTVVSDSQISVRVPSAAATGTVDIQVSTPGGTSKAVAGDRFTYTP